MAKAQVSALLSDLRGSVGGEVIILTRSGLAARRKPRYHYPANPSVQAGNDRMRQATAAWNTLSAAQFEAWCAYAETITHQNSVTGKGYHPAPKNVFVGLSMKFLQVNPGSPVPLNPTIASYLGDSLTVSATAISGGIRFIASGPNGVDSATELMIQPLANARCKPTKFYKHGTFHAFSVGSLAYDLSLEPGVYALACQFVRPSTGQTAGMRTIGTVEVG